MTATHSKVPVVPAGADEHFQTSLDQITLIYAALATDEA